MACLYCLYSLRVYSNCFLTTSVVNIQLLPWFTVYTPISQSNTLHQWIIQRKEMRWNKVQKQNKYIHIILGYFASQITFSRVLFCRFINLQYILLSFMKLMYCFRGPIFTEYHWMFWIGSTPQEEGNWIPVGIFELTPGVQCIYDYMTPCDPQTL